MQIVCPDCTTSYEISASALGQAGRMVRCAHCSHQWFVQAAELAESVPSRPAWPDDPRFEPSRFEERQRDDARFDVEFAGAPRVQGYDHAPEGWSDPVAQWSAEQVHPDDVVQFTPPPSYNDDEIEFAPPTDVRGVDDAPAIAPGDYVGDGNAPAESATLPATPGDGAATPDFFELQRRRKSRLKQKKKEKTGWFTIPRLIAAMVAFMALLVFERYNIVRLMPQTATLYSAVGLSINLRGLVFEDVKTITEMQDSVPVLVIEGVIRNVTGSNADVPRLRFAMRNNAGADIYSWTSQPERPMLTPGGVMGFRTRLASPPAESRAAYVRFVQRRDLVSTGNQ